SENGKLLANDTFTIFIVFFFSDLPYSFHLTVWGVNIFLHIVFTVFTFFYPKTHVYVFPLHFITSYGLTGVGVESPAKPFFFFSLNDKKNMRENGKLLANDTFTIFIVFFFSDLPYSFHLTEWGVNIFLHIVFTVFTFFYPKTHVYVFPLHFTTPSSLTGVGVESPAKPFFFFSLNDKKNMRENG